MTAANDILKMMPNLCSSIDMSSESYLIVCHFSNFKNTLIDTNMQNFSIMR